MYKVFLNDREIVIAQPADQNLFQHFDVFENIQTAEDVKNWFSKFADEEKSNALIIQNNPDEFLSGIFSQAFTPIEAAGGTVIRNNKLLFIFRNGKWDLPKGKTDAGETPAAAAIREVEEECGILGHTIVNSLPPTWHIYQSKWNIPEGEWILKKTHWFEMNYTGDNDGTPETGENISEIRWFGRNELGEVLENSYGNLRGLVGNYIKMKVNPNK